MAAIELPSPPPFRQVKFLLGYRQQITSITPGYLQTIERAIPAWTAEYASPSLNPERARGLESFLDRLEGSKYTFLAYDLRKAMPYAYRTQLLSTNPWGLPEVVSYNATTGNLSLESGLADALITTGDMIALQVDLCWYLFRITENAIFAGDGSVTVNVRPKLPIVIPPGTAIRYKRPCAEMKIIGTPDNSDVVDSLGPSMTFKAYQFFNRSSV